VQQTNRKEQPAEVKMVVEVDGNPVGFLNLDIDRLWPLVNHRKRDSAAIDWMDPEKLDAIMRAAVVKRLMARLQRHLYQTLGDEMVKAELDVEALSLKVETAVQTFGRTKKDIETLVNSSDRSPMDFYSFFWEYLLDEREFIDLKKEWKAAGTPRQ
jgi:hypothetical protein